MLNSLHLGGVAAAMVMATMIATSAGTASAAPMSSQMPYSENPAHQMVGFPTTDDDAEPILPRAYRSKCDDLTDATQRDHCFRVEQDDSFKDNDGQPNF
jgi:hypothetical protein